MTGIRRSAGALALAITATAAPGVAEAKNYGIDGHVVAPPSASKGRLLVPILLSESSERRMRLDKGLVRVSLPRSGRLAAPSATGRGTTAIAPSTLRVGDQLKASASLSRATLKRLRKRAVPSFRASRARVAARASAISTDELMRVLRDLGGQLNTLTGRVNSLSSLTGTQIGGLRSQFQSTNARLDTLEGTIGTLQTSLTQLLGRLNLLEGAVPNAAELLALQNTITSLLGRVTSIESLTGGLSTTLGTLTGTVTGLQGSLAGVGSQISALTGTVGALGSQLTSAQAALAQLPGLIAQVTALDGLLSNVTGRVNVAEDLLDTVGVSLTSLTGSVNGLTTTTNGLVSGLTGQGAQLGSLTTTVGGLTSNVTGLQGSLTSLTGTVGGLQTTVGGLTNQISSLTGTVGLLCGLPLIGAAC